MTLRSALIAVTAAAATTAAATAMIVIGGTSGAGAAVATRPVLTRVAASSGPVAGGRRVTLTGQNLGSARLVHFGTAVAAGLTRVSATTVQVTAPAHPSGTVDVRVSTAGGTTAITAADRYRYVDVPAVVAVAPGSGPVAGGTRVTVSGRNLIGVSSVRFGAHAGTSVRVFSSSTLSVTAPSGLVPGVVDVVVTTAYGRSAAVPADRYTYAAAPGAPSTAVGLAQLPAGAGAGATLTVEDMACTSTGSCYAVGYVQTGTGVQALIEQGSGTAWTGLFAPLPASASTTGTSALYSLDCPDATCVAVGTYTDSGGHLVPLVETLTGATWTVSTPVLPAGTATGYLTRIACAAATACAAYGPGSGGPLLAVLDGAEWTTRLATVPAPYLRSLFRPSGIACGSSSSCVVVGTHVGKTVHRAVADAWNGRTWTAAFIPLPAGATTPSALASVACLAAGHCVAVGSYRPASSPRASSASRPMVATWTGSWAVQAAALPAGAVTSPASVFGQLGSVSCSVNSCTATGVYATSAGRRGLVEIMDGGAWTARGIRSSSATDQVTTGCFGATVCGVAARMAVSPHRVVVVALSGPGGLSAVRLPFATGAATTDVTPRTVRCSPAGQCAVVGIVHSVVTGAGAAQYELAAFG